MELDRWGHLKNIAEVLIFDVLAKFWVIVCISVILVVALTTSFMGQNQKMIAGISTVVGELAFIAVCAGLSAKIAEWCSQHSLETRT
jgi:hypothetical protein